MSPRLFALDQGFPQPIVERLREYLADEVDLRPIAAIDARLTEDIDDWEILLALHHHAEHWDGLITTDSGMLPCRENSRWSCRQSSPSSWCSRPATTP